MAPAMTEAQLQEALRRLDRIALTLVFLLALAARFIFAGVLPFPGLDDPAFYLQVAQNLAEGKGLVIEAIWSYLVPFATVQHPSNEHWTPLASIVLSSPLAVFGGGYQTGQVVGALVGATLAPIAWWTARRLQGDGGRVLAFVAGLLIAFNPLLVYQAVTVDSAVYFSVLVALAVLAAARVPAAAGARWPGALGLLVGLAYLARNDGLLLLPLMLGWTAWCVPRERRGIALLSYALGAAVPVAPWLLRNALTFGSPFPVPALFLAALPDYDTLFRYGGASVWEGFVALDFGFLLRLRLEALAHNLSVVLVQALFPIAPLAFWSYLRLREQPLVAVGALGFAVLYGVSALAFPVLTMHGTFYHAVGGLVPWLTVLAVWGLIRLGRLLGERYFRDPGPMSFMWNLAVVILTVVQLVLAGNAAVELHHEWQQDFAIATRWLKQQEPGVVMTNQPHSLLYASGRPAIMLPVSDSPEVALQAARRYHARYLVGFGRQGRYPNVLSGDTVAGFTPAFAEGNVWAYLIQ